MKIKFSDKSYLALDEIAEFIYNGTQSKKFTAKYIRSIRIYIKNVLLDFPKLGRPAEEFGEGVRKLVYQNYSILYRIKDNEIEILTLYRENLPKI
jgi:plasmid stabilization system protein ParE